MNIGDNRLYTNNVFWLPTLSHTIQFASLIIFSILAFFFVKFSLCILYFTKHTHMLDLSYCYRVSVSYCYVTLQFYAKLIILNILLRYLDIDAFLFRVSQASSKACTTILNELVKTHKILQHIILVIDLYNSKIHYHFD